MAENSAIEWTDHTWNPWIGCQKVSPACDHCYAERDTPARVLRARGVETWGPFGLRVRTSEANWKLPERWNRRAEASGRRPRVFCASLADVFDNQVPPDWRVDLFALIERTPHLDWLLLTKRIGNVAPMLIEVAHRLFWMDHLDSPRALPNVWLGATVCNQAEADRDIPKLLDTPAAVRFLSIEPMLGPIDLARWHDWLGRSEGGMWCPDCPEYGVGIDPEEHTGCYGEVEDVSPYEGVDWVICGGESGPHARPMHPDWPRSLRDQCAAAGVPFLFKQHGEWIGTPDLRRLPGGGMPGFGAFDHCKFDMPHEAVRVGKKAAGRLLDGCLHDGYAEVVR